MLTLHPISSTTDDGAPSLEGAVWIDLLSPTEEEVEAVRKATGLEPPTREQLSEVESSSRLRSVGDTLYLSTPLLAGTAASSAELSPVGFLLNPRVLVTVRFSRFQAFEATAEAVDAEAEARPEPAAVFIQILEAVVDRALQRGGGVVGGRGQWVQGQHGARKARPGRPCEARMR